MVIEHSIANLKEKLEDQGKTLILLGYAQNNIGGTYHMLSICTKRIVLRCDVIWQNIYMDNRYQESKILRHTPISYKINTDPIIGIT